MSRLSLSFASKEESLSVRRFAVREQMSSLFEVSILAVSELEDLDLDSIDAIDLVAKLQQFTGQRIEEETMRGVRTVSDLVRIVAKQLEQSSGAAAAE